MSTRSLNRQRYSTVLEQYRESVLAFTDNRSAALLQGAGAALLEFAERAQSSAIQAHFFDAIALIQKRRGDIERGFRQEINEGFLVLGRTGPIGGRAEDSSALDGVELSLVEPDEMEESVAVENLISRGNADYFPDLYALSQRLGYIYGSDALTNDLIPAGPHHLVHSFRRSIEVLDIEVKVKVVLYALFDRFVLRHAKGLYSALNTQLIAAGVLTNLKPVPIRRDQPDSGRTNGSPGGSPDVVAPPAEPPDSAEPQALGTEIFDAIVELMSRRRPVGAGKSGGGRAPAASSPAQSQAQQRALLDAISSLQVNHTPEKISASIAEAPQFPALEVDTAFIERVKQTLSQEREEVLRSVDPDKVSPMDADLIDLIGMLFEYMLNDPVLPNVAKALISHLHTPYLKVALIDRRLLVDSQHPARRLLDQMVEAGSLWVEEGNPSRGLFPTMQQVVDRVLQEFNKDVGLFEELLQFLEERMRDQQRRSDSTEQRTQEAARGRERLTLAKQRATDEVGRLIGRHSPPAPVVRFLTKTWSEHLVFILLRDPQRDRGEAWERAIETAGRLAALFDPKATAEAKRRALAGISDLRRDINRTVRSMGSFSQTTVEALQGLLDEAERKKSVDLERDEITPPQPPTPAPEPGFPPMLATAAPNDDDLSEPERQMVARLRNLRFGTWFELIGDTGAAPRRVKLSWISPLTSTCMFVDRSGMQAEVKSLRDLAGEMLAGRARLIPRPKHPFIDRALVSIRKVLQGSVDRETPRTGSFT